MDSFHHRPRQGHVWPITGFTIVGLAPIVISPTYTVNFPCLECVVCHYYDNKTAHGEKTDAHPSPRKGDIMWLPFPIIPHRLLCTVGPVRKPAFPIRCPRGCGDPSPPSPPIGASLGACFRNSTPGFDPVRPKRHRAETMSLLVVCRSIIGHGYAWRRNVSPPTEARRLLKQAPRGRPLHSTVRPTSP